MEKILSSRRTDGWKTRLINLTLRDLSLADSLKPLEAFWHNPTGWKWNLFAGLLPPQTLLKLESIRVRLDYDGVDGIFWGPSHDGNFTIKSAYNL